MVGLGRKLGEGRAGAPGDQALLHRDGLGKKRGGSAKLGKAAENGENTLEKRQKTAKKTWKNGRLLLILHLI